jgi:hypothetical protein
MSKVTNRQIEYCSWKLNWNWNHTAIVKKIENSLKCWSKLSDRRCWKNVNDLYFRREENHHEISTERSNIGETDIFQMWRKMSTGIQTILNHTTE